jgi:hypothetical protein
MQGFFKFCKKLFLHGVLLFNASYLFMTFQKQDAPLGLSSFFVFIKIPSFGTILFFTVNYFSQPFLRLKSLI